jgi:hypothetical protein
VFAAIAAAAAAPYVVPHSRGVPVAEINGSDGDMG